MRYAGGSRSYASRLFAGDLTAFGGPPTDEIVAGFIRAEQVAMVLRHAPGIMLANACNAVVLVLALWDSPDRLPAVLWGTVLMGTTLFITFRGRTTGWWRSPRRCRAEPSIGWCAMRFCSDVPGQCCRWRSSRRLPMVDNLVITCLCAGMLAGGALAFATIPVAAIAFIAPIFLGAMICLGRIGDFAYLLVAVLVLIYAMVLLRGVFAYSFEFTRSPGSDNWTAKRLHARIR